MEIALRIGRGSVRFFMADWMSMAKASVTTVVLQIPSIWTTFGLPLNFRRGHPNRIYVRFGRGAVDGNGKKNERLRDTRCEGMF